MKATPNPFILKILHEEGCGVDCSSETELMLSGASGFAGHEIMFSSNETQGREFARAYRQGAIINLDDFTLIDTLEQACGIPETVCCRFNPGGEFSIGNHIMDQPKDAKYGMTREQLTQAYRLLMPEGREALWLARVSRVQHADERLLSDAGQNSVHDGGRAAPRDRRENCVHQPFRRRGHSVSAG